jgi:hypothetical protein
MTNPRANDGPRPFPAAPDSFEESSSSARFDAEVDFSSERPASTVHGLRPDGSVKWLVGGLVGGSLLLAGIVTLLRGPDDDEASKPARSDVAVVEAVLAAPLEQAIIALEPARMEAITAEAVRGMTDKPIRRELARRPAETPTTTSPAVRSPAAAPTTATPRAATPNADATPARTVAPTAVPVRDLPPPPEPDAPREDEPAGDAADEPAPSAPADDAPAPKPSSDAPAEDADAGDRSSAPS